MSLQFPLSGGGGAAGPSLQTMIGASGPLAVSWTQRPSFFDTTAISIFNVTSGSNVWDGHIWNIGSGFVGANSSSTSTNSAIAPDGSQTATTWTELTNNGNHVLSNIGQNSSFAVNVFRCPHRLAGIFKAGARTRVVMQITFGLNGTAYNASVGFDLVGGVKFDQATDANWTILATGTKSLGNGWWLVWFDAQETDTTAISSAQFHTSFYMDAGSGSAARNISYVGDGSSGLLQWWVNLSPTAGWGLGFTPLFYDDFTSNTVDASNTQNTSLFKWFVKSDWPNVPTTNWGIGAGAPAFTGSITASNSILKVVANNSPAANFNNGGANGYLFTAFADPVTPSLVHGFTFPYNKPSLFQARFAFDYLPGNGTISNLVSYWSQATEGLAGGVLPFAEVDFFECIPAFSQRTHIDSDSGGGSWTSPGGSNHLTGIRAQGGHSGLWLGNGNTSNNYGIGNQAKKFIAVSTLYIPSGANGGSNIGVLFAAATPVPDTSLAADATEIFITSYGIWASTDPFASVENQHAPLIITNGNLSTTGGVTVTSAQTWPTYWDYISLIQ